MDVKIYHLISKDGWVREAGGPGVGKTNSNLHSTSKIKEKEGDGQVDDQIVN